MTQVETWQAALMKRNTGIDACAQMIRESVNLSRDFADPVLQLPRAQQSTSALKTKAEDYYAHGPVCKLLSYH
jgi:hypothetical protein